MNERIVKLISEADAYASTIVEKYTPDNGQVSYLWEDAFRKKFAELIVQECYVHCSGQLMDKKLAEAHGLTYNDGVMDCAVGLKLHFGVE